MPWTRLLLAIAVSGPALCIGGVPPLVVPAFALVVAALLGRMALRPGGVLRAPVWVGLGLAAAAVTTVTWLPLPHAVRELLAPGLTARVSAAGTAGSDAAWPSISPAPGDGMLETCRLLCLCALFVACRRVKWTTIAIMIAAVAGGVAVIGFVQSAVQAHRILGVYLPVQVELWRLPPLMTTFVNSNHQGSLFLLGLGCVLAIAHEERRAVDNAGDLDGVRRHSDRLVAALGLGGMIVAALVLSLSRGALIAFVLFGTTTLLVKLRTHDAPSRRVLATRRLLVSVTMIYAAIVAGLSTQGAWQELATLWQPDGRITGKFELARRALALVPLSPIVGIGRGAFHDLAPQLGVFDPTAPARVYTHLETTPVTMLVEWGPAFGLAMTGGLAWWWWRSLLDTRTRSDRLARQVALFGIAAVAIHNLVDFNLEFLGVTAPLVALAGSLSAGPDRTLNHRPTAVGLVVGLIACAAGGAWAAPRTWSSAGSGPDPLAALRWRPLSADLHRAAAHAAANAGRWEAAREHARRVTEMAPHDARGWLLLGTTETAFGLPDANGSVRRALELLQGNPTPEFVAWLIERYEPERLAAIVPPDASSTIPLARALLRSSPAHARTIAAARLQVRPDDPAARATAAEVAIRTRHGALALHHARLLRQARPGKAESHLLVARAYDSFTPARREDAVEALRQGLDQVRDPSERGVLEEAMVVRLLRLGGTRNLDEARRIGPDLSTRPGPRKARSRREKLLRSIPSP